MKYITRKGGATVTIFVPYDCKNHCPFCINKAEYSDTSKFDIDKIIHSIKIMSAITPECDFVLTGGEPLADINGFLKIVEAINGPVVYDEDGIEGKCTGKHKVFINTTLPITVDESYIATLLNSLHKTGLITGINVSRHLTPYVQECSDNIFKLLDFEPRINCVLYNLDLARKNLSEDLKKFIERFRNISSHVQFRKDYVLTTEDNLYDEENDQIFSVLKDTFKYIGPFDQYRMRCGYEFNHDGYRVTYHKTLPYSKIGAMYQPTPESIPMKAYAEPNLGTYILYDIIIKQDGTIKEDWDICSADGAKTRTCDKLALPLDLNAYINAEIEEYK